MAQIEPMDIESNFEDKENAIQHTNVLPRTPCTEKGCEELDVSELSMKLRYSITPVSSPMSKSFTTSCRDNLTFDNPKNDNMLSSNNLTNSLNSTLLNYDNKLSKMNPLQPLSTDLLVDFNGNPLMRRSLDINTIDNNVAITVNENHVDDHLSLPSTSSSAAHTPEATTPTKELPKDGGSPIMRGLKSVFSMFRTSQSPTPQAEATSTQHSLSPVLDCPAEVDQTKHLVSTLIAKNKEAVSTRNSPLKDSVVFKDDLEKELQWKEETITFKNEKTPIHKLFSLQPPLNYLESTQNIVKDEDFNSPVEYMDISQNESVYNKKITDISVGISTDVTENINNVESDSEFVDCETTITKNELNSSKTEINNITDTEPLNISSNVKKRSVSEAHQLQSTYPLNETATLDFNSDVEVIKAIDPATESIAIIKHSQGEKEIIETNIESTVVNYEQHDTIECGNNYDDNVIPTLRLPDIVSMPIHGDSFASNKPMSIIAENISNKKGNVFEGHKKDTSKETDIKNVSAVIIELNYDDTFIMKSNNQNTSTVENDTVIGTKSINNSSVENDAIHISSNEVCQAIDIIVDNSESISNLDRGRFKSDEIISKENETTNNLHYNLDCEKPQDNLPLQILMEKSDIDLNTTQHIQPSDTFCDMTTIKLNDTIDNGVEKQKNNVIYCNRPLDVIENETIPTKTDICKIQNEQNNVFANITKTTEDTNISLTNNLATHVSDSNTLIYSNENNNVPSDIPLPSDSDLDQESVREKQNLPVEATNLNTTDLGHTERKLECKMDDQIINKTINETSEHKENPNVVIQNNINGPINPEIIDSILDIHNQNYNQVHKYGVDLDNIINDFHLIVTNSNITADISGEKHVENVDVNGTICQNVIDNNITMLKNNDVMFDTINATTELGKSNDSIIFPNPDDLMISNNVLGDQPKIDCDEEIITSASSSPYVSVTEMAIGSINQDKNSLEDIENPFVTNTKIAKSPPISPKLINKSYNFSFDDIVDPFATNTKIRVSPTPEYPKQQTISTTVVQDNKSKKKSNVQKRELQKNKRKSQTERKSLSNSKSFNGTFDTIANNNEHKPHLDINNQTYNTGDNTGVYQDARLEEMEIKDFNKINNTTQILDNSQQRGIDLAVVENCCDTLNQLHNIQAGVSDRDSARNTSLTKFITAQAEIITENVLALPCVYEASCDNLITKSVSKMSPPSVIEVASSSDNSKVTKKSFLVAEQCKQTGINECEELETECSSNISFLTISSKNTDEYHCVRDISECQDDKDRSTNISIVTCSSKISDENHTGREINTEDEDTVEGPFFESSGDSDRINVLRDAAPENDMMQFDMPSARNKDENLDNGELFIDAETFEFLLNQNKSAVIADSGKESLFLKFDPLYAKRVSSDGVLAALSKYQKTQSTPSKMAKLTYEDVNTELPSTSKSDINYVEGREDSDVSSTSKPMMVVNPAVNPIVVSRKISTPKLNRQSLTFTSPAIAVIDRLLSLSGNNSFMDQNTSIPQSSRDHNETDIAITQLREMLAEKEIHVHNLRSESKDLKNRLSSLETKMKGLETESEQRLKKVNDLNERLAEKTKINKSMAFVVEEYERTIASLITEMEQEKKHNSEERMKLVKERDEQTAHLASMEVSFNDLHSKYEKTKQIILSMKANEDTYKKSIQDFEDNLLKMQNNYELLKQHATSKLNHANQELEKFNKAHESEVLKLNALIKRKEMHITSLEETLTQKTKANEELTAICDELINKVG